MNFFGVHFCTDELMLLLMGLPFVGVYWRRFVCKVAALHARIFGSKPHAHVEGPHAHENCGPKSEEK